MRQGVIGCKKEVKMKCLILLFLILTLLPLKTQGGQWYNFGLPSGMRPGPGSALTYGRPPTQAWGKLFLLIGDQTSNSYSFWWADAKISGSGTFLTWYELQTPDPGVPPQADAAICYFYDDVTLQEKVLAVFGGCRDIWCYDVLANTWIRDGPIWGEDLVGEGCSMEFWGFRYIYGERVPSFYLIKGGQSYDFLRYNRGPMTPPPRGNSEPFPYWECLANFNISGSDERFYAGADLAIHHYDHDSIYAMRGWDGDDGLPFGLYIISQNRWLPRDNIIHPGVKIGGALAAHPRWGDINPYEGDTLTDEVNSILHCLRGGYTNEFDCYDLPDRWSTDPPPQKDIPQLVASGSDLVWGTVYYGGRRYGLWALGGNNWTAFWFYAKNPLWEDEGYGGGQSPICCEIVDSDVIALPNPARSNVIFRLPMSKSVTNIQIYSKNGKSIRCLKPEEGNYVWDMKNKDGKAVPAGIYFYTVNIENKEIRGKIVVNK